jgi:flagellar biosynthesis protein FlhG
MASIPPWTTAAHPSPAETPAEPDAGAPRLLAVGGGKGGVGKSVVTANLAAAMAGSGRRCAVIDADLGGANLHTLLGVSRPRYSLSHLLTGEVASLGDLMVQTSVPNLWLVSGNQALLEMANPTPRQKEMLLRQIRGLDVDDVVLDLGAGSAFNVLDFFLLARRGLVVTTPELTAIENAEHFIRAAFYRSLREVARRPDVAAAIRRLRDNGTPRRVRSAPELIALVRAIDPPAAKPLEDRAQAFAPMLVVNQLRTPEHRSVGPQMVASCRERLGVAIELAATIEADANVAEAVARRQVAVQAFPMSRFSQRIEALAQRLRRGVPEEPLEGDDARGRAWPCEASAPVTRSAGVEKRASAAPGDTEARRRRLPPIDRNQPGAYLCRCREALGLSLADLTERTRIRILDHIEHERFDELPPEPYLKGYLLEYARELGVPDIAELVRCYLARAPGRAAPAPPRQTPAPTSRLRLRKWRG